MRLLKIGRDASCDIVLHSDKVSSLHAEMTVLNNGDILLEDKNSKNGTFLMNKPIKPGTSVSVRRGDAIRFGDVELMWNQIARIRFPCRRITATSKHCSASVPTSVTKYRSRVIQSADFMQH